MKLIAVAYLAALAAPVFAAALTVDVNVMPRVVFTGDSQTCGRVGAIDYPQMLSWEMPIRVINTAVGGTNTRHLLKAYRTGLASAAKGEKVVHGEKVGWHAGPYPGQRIRLGKHEYTIDRIEVVSYKERKTNIWITEPAAEDFEGRDYAIEAGWRTRVAAQRPDYVCFMYSVNDTGYTSDRFKANLKEMLDRTRVLGAQPIFLSGVPLMDAAKGGSHPSHNRRVAVRAKDLAEFCAENRVPFGDVFSALMALDEQNTCTWRDTVHPTTDGSTAALNALRAIFRGIGLSANPYYLRGYRATGEAYAPGEGLTPITTSQPDYNKQNRPDENHFDLEAIRVRDEYGLIAAADGQVLRSGRPIVLECGVGDAGAIKSATVEVAASKPAKVAWFDPKTRAWIPLAEGVRVSAPLDPRAAVIGRAIWLSVDGDDGVELDYVAIHLEGGVQPFKPAPANTAITWPPADYLKWAPSASLIANGDLAAAAGDAPKHWRAIGSAAHYRPAGVVAKGDGSFVKNRRVDTLYALGQRFTKTVRPLDVVVVKEGPHGIQGRFIVARVEDDERLLVRRYPKQEADGVAFEVRASSGCAVAPGGCLVECRDASRWQSAECRLAPGSYRLGVFYRAYDPARMDARHRPGKVARVSVVAADGGRVLAQAELEASFQWQRAWLEFRVAEQTQAVVRLEATSATCAQYTGITLEPR